MGHIKSHLKYLKSFTKCQSKLQFIKMKNTQIVLLIVLIVVCFAAAQLPFREDYTHQESERNDDRARERMIMNDYLAMKAELFQDPGDEFCNTCAGFSAGCSCWYLENFCDNRDCGSGSCTPDNCV
ncbi:uncharacterized protein LOC144642977 isoform X1 [Oculina patagonica]